MKIKDLFLRKPGGGLGKAGGRNSLKWLLAAAILSAALGVSLRFFDIARKPYWGDEVFTSLRVSGFTRQEAIDSLFHGRAIYNEDLQRFQRVNQQKTTVDTLISLAKDAPTHTPLYYLLARFWSYFFSDPRIATRSLSIIISLAALPLIYWLCMELFGSALAGWLSVAIIAVSPFHMLYAQEARPYSLFTVMTLFSSCAFLGAIRKKAKKGWLLYALTLTLGLYSHPFFIFVMAAHGLYLACSGGIGKKEALAPYLRASLAGLIMFSPWVIVIASNLHQAFVSLDWLNQNMKFSFFISIWLLNLSRVFFDLNSFDLNFHNPVSIAISVFAVYATLFTFFKSGKKAGLFIAALIAAPLSAFFLLDLFLGGVRSLTNRYLSPAYLGFQLACAYFLASKITRSREGKNRTMWMTILFLLLFSGLFSCFKISRSSVWWNKFGGNYNIGIADQINGSDKPLVYSDASVIRVLSLSHSLNPGVRYRLVIKPNTPDIESCEGDTFVYMPSDFLLDGLQAECGNRLVPVRELGPFHNKLWKIKQEGTY